MAERFVIFHGHFYQPPRVNPWLGKVLQQDSAEPLHDWNERIFTECYQPNTGARVLDDKGLTVDVVNNFEFMSFNFGALLADWFQKKHSFTWDKIKKADAASKERLGSGNALACAYSHTIIPLDLPLIRKTDILWGLKAFEESFGRPAEALWLPETAVNRGVIDDLIARNLKYVFLVATQIQSARLINGRHEIDLSSGNIDTRYPYKITTEKGSITCFVGHPGISHAACFENLMKDSKTAADMIESSFSQKTRHDQVIVVLFDGETFGHHQPFAERGLAHLLKYELPKRGIKVVNPAYIRKLIPVEWEIKIKDGREGEGTSWSCSHGLGRWREDCGCGKKNNFTQAWRGPLRDAFNFVAGKVAGLYEKKMSGFLKAGDSALENYPRILDNFSKTDEFIGEFQKKELAFSEKQYVLNLFEMLRQTLFTFTSCGWFWAEISGIETVQNMAFAARAIEIYKKLTGEDIEPEFLKILKKAPSNADFSDGADVFKQCAATQKESIFTFVAGEIMQEIASGLAHPQALEHSFFHFFIDTGKKTAEFFQKITEEKMVFEYEIVDGDFPFEIKLKGVGLERNFTVDNIFGEARYSIMNEFWLKKIVELKDTYNLLLDHYLEFESVYRLFGKPIKEIEPVIAKVLMFQLLEIEEFRNLKKIPVVRSLVQIVKEYNLNLDGFYTRQCLQDALDKEIDRFIIGDFSKVEFLKLLFDIYFLLSPREKENIYHSIIFDAVRDRAGEISKLSEHQKRNLREICAAFRINPDIA
ncbi:MAG: DUF3536 domain-containing protein, partial [bacterium]